MPKQEWGVKRVCPTTGKRFYDLNKTPIVSPYTGEVVEAQTGKTRSIVADSEDAETTKTKTAEKDIDSDVIDDADVGLGDDVLEEDDDDNVSLDDIADVSDEDNES